MADSIAKAIGPNDFTEDVAGDDQDIDILLGTQLSDALHRPLNLSRSIDPPQAVAEMPIGGVQESHLDIIKARFSLVSSDSS